MGRPKGTKNVMRSAVEKERLVLEYLNGHVSRLVITSRENIGLVLFKKWIKKYKTYGIDGFISRTGKHLVGVGRPRKAQTREQELEQENLKLKIEVERLKKGYQVKGAGIRKEYVTIKRSNLK